MMQGVQITGKVTLSQLRLLTGMTQKKFAMFVGIPYTTYRRYEKRIENAGFSEIVRICDRTGVGIEKIKA